MNIIQQNQLPTGIDNMADLHIHEASLAVGVAIQKLSKLGDYWAGEINHMLEIYTELRRELPDDPDTGKHAGHSAAHEAIKYGTMTHYTSYAKGAAGL